MRRGKNSTLYTPTYCKNWRHEPMSKTATLCKILITKNRYTYDDMYAKLDLFLLMGRITEEEYVELTGMLVEPKETEAADQTETETP